MAEHAGEAQLGTVRATHRAGSDLLGTPSLVFRHGFLSCFLGTRTELNAPVRRCFVFDYIKT